MVAGKRKCQFHVKAFPKWRWESTALEVTYQGKPARPLPPAVKGLRAFHRAGQTFITWREIDDPFGDKPPALGALKEAAEAAEAKRCVRYRVYRHDRPIDRRSLADAVLLAEGEPFSGFDVRGVSLDRLICRHQRRALPLRDPRPHPADVHLLRRHRVAAGLRHQRPVRPAAVVQLDNTRPTVLGIVR
jgi:hypothetical protein